MRSTEVDALFRIIPSIRLSAIEYSGAGESSESTVGKEACPAIAKTSLIGLLLACSIGKLYVSAGFGVVQEFC